MKPDVILSVFSLVLFSLSCEKIPLVEDYGLYGENEQTQIVENDLRSEQRFRHPSMSFEKYQGAINAVKKAYQLTEISFTPLRPIAYNIGTYQANTTYRGMIYSSVKEIGTYVGSNISFHTFMTAIHNPRSKIYTDRIDKSPYHGTNCRSYYGTVCSDFVSYSLGLAYIGSDFAVSEEMEELDYSNIDGFHIGDVLWDPNHVAIITNVIRDRKDRVATIEISEAIKKGCRRFSISKSGFKSKVAPSYEKIFRYKHLERNSNYSSFPEFVPVFDEVRVPYQYNEDICVDKGDQSCYFVGEDVVLNILSSGDEVEIFKNGLFHSSVCIDSDDIRLCDLGFGLYQARIKTGDKYSDFTSWIMVDWSIESSKDEMIVYFKSINSRPISFSFCDRSGSRKIPFTEVLCRSFTEEEIALGYIRITQDKVNANRQYFRITFATDFGIITTTPIKWI